MSILRAGTLTCHFIALLFDGVALRSLFSSHFYLCTTKSMKILIRCRSSFSIASNYGTVPRSCTAISSALKVKRMYGFDVGEKKRGVHKVRKIQRTNFRQIRVALRFYRVKLLKSNRSRARNLGIRASHFRHV